MAVALGLQDTLANIFAGLHLILSKQLRLNDYIKLSKAKKVEYLILHGVLPHFNLLATM